MYRVNSAYNPIVIFLILLERAIRFAQPETNLFTMIVDTHASLFCKKHIVEIPIAIIIYGKIIAASPRIIVLILPQLRHLTIHELTHIFPRLLEIRKRIFLHGAMVCKGGLDVLRLVGRDRYLCVIPRCITAPSVESHIAQELAGNGLEPHLILAISTCREIFIYYTWAIDSHIYLACLCLYISSALQNR